MLAIVITGAMLGTIVLVGLVAGYPIAKQLLDAYLPTSPGNMKIRGVELQAKIEKMKLEAEQTGISKQFKWYEEQMPIRQRQMMEQRAQQQEFTREMMGEQRAATREEILMNKLIPQAPTRMSPEEVGLQAGSMLLQAGQETPAMLPFDPNYPITAFAGGFGN